MPMAGVSKALQTSPATQRPDRVIALPFRSPYTANVARAWISWTGIGAAVTLIGVVAFYPRYRLAQEMAAVRAEGVPIEMNDVRQAIPPVSPSENAADLMRSALKADQADERRLGKSLSTERLVPKGKASPAQTDALRALYLTEPDLIARWRRVAERPRLVFDRHWEDGYALLLPEYAGYKIGQIRLVAAARLGLNPRENLLAAARLSNLIRQDPTEIAALISMGTGRVILREADREGIAHEVESALGPPIDARWAYLPEIPSGLDLARRAGEPDFDRWFGAHVEESLWDRLRRAGSGRENAMSRLVQDDRDFWRALPKDGTEYAKIKAARDRWLPQIYNDLFVIVPAARALFDDPTEMDRLLDDLQAYEQMRQAIRKGGAGDSSIARQRP